jgi:hypothetical protein
MESFKKYSKRSLLINILLIGGLFLAIGVAVHYSADNAFEMVKQLKPSIGENSEFKLFFDKAQHLKDLLQRYAISGFAIFGLLFAILVWLILRSSSKNLFKDTPKAKKVHPGKGKVSKAPAADVKKQQLARDQRLYLQILSVLQREGRLLDFLAEDLSLYEDAQIGAAARNIHEGCKKVIHKNLKTSAVIDKSEGEDITIESGFNPNEVTLTGNVVGEPPFRGVLRHKGWKVQKLELPTLSADQEASIIAPAEVEIQ